MLMASRGVTSVRNGPIIKAADVTPLGFIRGWLASCLELSARAKERLVWIAVIVMLGTVALHFQVEAAVQTERRLAELSRLVHAQQEVILQMRATVDIAGKSVEIAAQGRLDCAQSLEELTKHQQLIDLGLGLRGVAARRAK